MQRDTAATIVKVIAVLEWVGAAFGILLALLFIFGGSLFAQTVIAEMSAEELGGLPADQMMSYLQLGLMVFGAVVLILSALGILTGIGLWRSRNWGRILALIGCWLSGIFGLFGIIGSFSGSASDIVFGVFVNGINVAISATIIWLLQFEPTVVGLFQAPATTSTKRVAKKRRT